MGNEAIHFHEADEPPDFYQAVLGMPMTEEQLDRSYNKIKVSDIEAVLAKADKYAGCEVLCPKEQVFPGEFCAVIRCPSGSIIILVEEQSYGAEL